MERIIPVYIHTLSFDEVFVFGSNMAGRHGKGAALDAIKWGASYGVGFGMSGRTFAIPTKDKKLQTLPLAEIASFIDLFIRFAEETPNKKFLVTKIACGYAGYNPKHIAPFFKPAASLSHVFLPVEFWKVINQQS